MAAVFRIEVPGKPMGKGRPRFVRKTGAAFTPQPTASRENLIRVLAMQAWEGAPMECAARLRVEMVVPVPKSWTKKARAAALAGDDKPTGKPDADNCVKLVCDSLNQIVWHDDSQVVDMTATKRYGEVGCTIIEVEAVA